jgi:hypothetical protein
VDCRASQRMEFDRCRYFDISSDAFCPFTISDQTISKITTLRRGELRRSIVERFDTQFDM